MDHLKYSRLFLSDSDKPPDDPSERFWFFKRKQQLNRWHRSYGNSLVGGNDRAKIITVTETGAKKKKGKNKEGKMVSHLGLTTRL